LKNAPVINDDLAVGLYVTQDGDELFSTKTDIAPLIGLTFVARF
jgi:hypothetical protein